MSNIKIGSIIPISGILAATGAALILMDIIGFGVSGRYYIYYRNDGTAMTASGSGFWSGIMLLLAGGLGIGGAQIQHHGGDGKCTGMASMVFCILSSINTFGLLVYYIYLAAVFHGHPYIIVHMLLHMLAFPMSIVGAAVIGRLACAPQTIVVTQYYDQCGAPAIVYGQQQPQQNGQQQQYSYQHEEFAAQQPQCAPPALEVKN